MTTFHWTNENYLELVKSRRAECRPLPPAHHIRHAGHHLLLYADPMSGCGMMQCMMVAQWSPNNREWYHSNDLATMSKPIGDLRNWHWVSAVEVSSAETIAQCLAVANNQKEISD